MADQTARQRARTAAAEDTPEARAALLRDELRRGVADPGLTRWCAYAGGEEAQATLGWQPLPSAEVCECRCHEADIRGWCMTHPGSVQPCCVGSLAEFASGLPSLAESCSLADVGGVKVGAPWLLVRTWLEVGRACRAWLHRSRPGPGGGDAQLAAGRWLRVVRSSGRALDAAQAWVACPCEEHLRAWAALYREDTPDWIPNPVAMVRTTVESLPTYFGWQMKAAGLLLPPETIRSCVLRVGTEEQQRRRESV